jgi:hypothetical protein
LKLSALPAFGQLVNYLEGLGLVPFGVPNDRSAAPLRAAREERNRFAHGRSFLPRIARRLVVELRCLHLRDGFRSTLDHVGALDCFALVKLLCCIHCRFLSDF